MPADDPTAVIDAAAAAEEAQAQADFDSGMPDEPAKPARAAKADAPATPEVPADPAPATPAPAAAAAPAPKYVKVTEEQFANLTAAAAKIAGYDKQFSTAFGTLGNMQKELTALRTAAPGNHKFEIPKDAFAAMERDFPELAQHTRAAIEATLRGITGSAGGADIDPDLVKKLVTEHATEARINAEIEALTDEYPGWRTIVGQVNTSRGETPDPANPFRKWLATQDAAFQAKLNSTDRAAVISRAISRFQAEVKPAAAATPTLKDQLRSARIAAAVQPRGDGGHAAPARTDDAEFEAGFANG